MGYCFRIGDGIQTNTVEDGEIISQIDVLEVSLKDAPVFEFDELTGNSNIRSPSYTGWFEFCKDAGNDIFSLFYNSPNGMTGIGTLIPIHPGFANITKKHYGVIKNAMERRMKFGNEAGFSEGQDFTLARLIWLEFWFRWALENCKNPGIQNS